MALKAGRVGLNKDLVDEFGNLKQDIPTGDYYTKTQTDNKFETKSHASNNYQTKTLSDPIVVGEETCTTVEGALEALSDAGGEVNINCGFTPVGTIISVMGNNAPQHYLACNGQVVNIAEYPELADYFEEQFGSVNEFGGDGTTTFGIPDLRGEFLRGTGTNSHSGEGSGANVGEHQNATVAPLLYSGFSSDSKTYLAGRVSSNASAGTSVVPTSTDTLKQGPDKAKQCTYTAASTTTATTNAYAYTSRPTNTSVLYCIAVRDIYVDARYDYSTDEKVVGTWIDGKPLYQKTFVNTLPVVSTDGTYVTKDIDITDLDVDMAFVAEAFCESGGTSTYTLPLTYLTDAGLQVKVRVADTNIQLTSGYTGFNNVPVYVTIRYTKTTV